MRAHSALQFNNCNSVDTPPTKSFLLIDKVIIQSTLKNCWMFYLHDVTRPNFIIYKGYKTKINLLCWGYWMKSLILHVQGDQIGTFGAKFEKFGTLRLELATKSPELRCQLFWHPFGTLQKFAKEFPKCLEIAWILKKNANFFGYLLDVFALLIEGCCWSIF